MGGSLAFFVSRSSHRPPEPGSELTGRECSYVAWPAYSLLPWLGRKLRLLPFNPLALTGSGSRSNRPQPTPPAPSSPAPPPISCKLGNLDVPPPPSPTMS